ncbi:MAG: LysR family transcriptional regulator [Pseudomonadota bacterium]
MNWNAISFDWNHIRAFLATVDEGSLSAAARVLGQTQPTLSRQITMLEESLDLTLFERGTRVMKLTDAGAELLRHVRAMADSATQISRVATGQSQTIAGTVRITSSDGLATYTLPRIVIALRKMHPGIHVELVPSNDVSDLTRRDADIAIRHARPEQPDLVAKRLADIHIGLFAAKEYLDQIGPITGPEDLKDANFIGYQHPERLVPQMQALGIPVTKDNFGVTTTHGPTLLELTRAGGGITLLPFGATGAPDGLKPVLPNLPPMPMQTWLVTHREIQTSRRIRITFDHLVAELSKGYWSDMTTQKT